MPISIDIPGCTSPAPFKKVFTFLLQVDARFSPYKVSSEVSRYAQGLIAPAQLSPDLAHVIAECTRYEKLTNGYFSPYYNSTFDPSGYVKAWALEQTRLLLISLGFTTFLINAGGDMVAWGKTKQWKLGIQSPFDAQKLHTTITLTQQAIATSGAYVRGAHILDPHTQQAPNDLASVTVYGPDIIQADVLATTCIAMGFERAQQFMKTHPTYTALFIQNNPGLRA